MATTSQQFEKVSSRQVYRVSDGQIIVQHCRWATSFYSRLRGLIGVRNFTLGEEGLWFSKCHDIHMWFMSIPIDVIFLRQVSDFQFQISSYRGNLKPWRFLPAMDWKATDTLELPNGTIEHYKLKPGDIICSNSG